jgi:hypothetical protein
VTGATPISRSGDWTWLFSIEPGSEAEDFVLAVKPTPAGHAPMSAVRVKGDVWRVSHKVAISLHPSPLGVTGDGLKELR